MQKFLPCFQLFRAFNGRYNLFMPHHTLQNNLPQDAHNLWNKLSLGDIDPAEDLKKNP